MPRKTVEKDGQKQEVDDVERALRLETPLTFEEGVDSATVNILVPADLPSGLWGLAFVGELLAEDEKSVVASAGTQVRYLQAVKQE